MQQEQRRESLLAVERAKRPALDVAVDEVQAHVRVGRGGADDGVEEPLTDRRWPRRRAGPGRSRAG